MKTTFKNWLRTFIEEKEIDADETFELTAPHSIYTSNIFTYDVVLQTIERTSREEQILIKSTMVNIDFRNGDIKHYLRHLAQALIV